MVPFKKKTQRWRSSPIYKLTSRRLLLAPRRTIKQSFFFKVLKQKRNGDDNKVTITGFRKDYYLLSKVFFISFSKSYIQKRDGDERWMIKVTPVQGVFSPHPTIEKNNSSLQYNIFYVHIVYWFIFWKKIDF